MQRQVLIPGKSRPFHIDEKELLTLVQRNTSEELLQHLQMTDSKNLHLILMKTFKKSFVELKVEYLRHLPNLESLIDQSDSLESLINELHTNQLHLERAIHCRFNRSYIEVKVQSRLRHLGVISRAQVVEFIRDSDSLNELAQKLKMSPAPLSQYLSKTFPGRGFYEIKYDEKSDQEVIALFKIKLANEADNKIYQRYLVGRFGQKYRRIIRGEVPLSAKAGEVTPRPIDLREPELVVPRDEELLHGISNMALSDLQKHFHMNEEQLCRIIKERFDKSYGEALLDAKSDAAFWALVDSCDTFAKLYNQVRMDEDEFRSYLRCRFLSATLDEQNRLVAPVCSKDFTLEQMIQFIRTGTHPEEAKNLTLEQLKEKIVNSESLEDLAGQLRLTSYNTHRLIKQHFNKPYTQVFLDAKIGDDDEVLKELVRNSADVGSLAAKYYVAEFILSKYIKSRLGLTYSKVKFDAISDDRMRDNFKVATSQTSLIQILRDEVGGTHKDVGFFLESRYGKEWQKFIGKGLPADSHSEIKKENPHIPVSRKRVLNECATAAKQSSNTPRLFQPKPPADAVTDTEEEAALPIACKVPRLPAACKVPRLFQNVPAATDAAVLKSDSENDGDCSPMLTR